MRPPLRHLALAFVVTLPVVAAQQYDPAAFGELHWRNIGPHRGGRTRAIAGVPSQPATFYMGVCNGGVWRTTDAGRTWQPIFDDQPTGSIGCIAIAPSDPRVIYVGSGEGLQRPDLSTGDGIYRSSDGGATWAHLGLRDGQQIPAIAIDPRNPDRILVAVLGHPYGPSSERGIYRSTDGGKTFAKVLSVDDDTGGSDIGGNDVDIDPSDSQTVYATLWEARQGPWENAAWSGTGGGIFKSVDGGTSWQKLTEGLPAVVQANVAICAGRPQRLYATVASERGVGIYRSDDGGTHWSEITEDRRPASRIGGGDLPMPVTDATDPDHVIVTSTVAWHSRDGGKTWLALKGAPGGDDYQNGWIDPAHPEIVALASDQGAVISLNGGATWSSWYNQPTAQLYHVSADNAFPYRVYSGQQESGSVGIASRGDDGQITFREWHPVAVDEYGYVAPDPLDPDVIYGGHIVSRFDRRTGQVQSVGPAPGGAFRIVRTQPVVFSTVDPHVLFYANNVLWKTTDGGTHWQQLSPDLTRADWTVPDSVGKYRGQDSAKPSQRGVIYTVAPSYLDLDRIWVGSDDGRIHTTADGGKSWTDVTPKQLGAWAKVSLIDAGHFDGATAYAAVNTIRLDDMRPHLFRTHDGGASWTEITTGLPADAPTNAIREDPKRAGLLFTGTERAVHVSFDDGDHWQPLRLNMAASSVRDLIVKDDDLVAATHGRGFWILDDITALRQLSGTAVAEPVLFAPQRAWRVRWNLNTDTPLPPDEPSAPNPPEGAILDYWLPTTANEVTLEVRRTDGGLVRRFTSADVLEPADPSRAPVPLYWYRAPQHLGTGPGLHRFAWDLHMQPFGKLDGSGGLPISAIAHDTAPSIATPLAAPGVYTVALLVDGKRFEQSLTLALDPRVTTPADTLADVFATSRQLYDAVASAHDTLATANRVHAQIAALKTDDGSLASALADLDQRLTALRGEAPAGRGSRRGTGGGSTDTLQGAIAAASGAMMSLASADAAPTAAQQQACRDATGALARAISAWERIGLDDINRRLAAAHLPTLGGQ
ncbi:MAG: glycoside hydrolase [Planctomycetota bacterium]